MSLETYITFKKVSIYKKKIVGWTDHHFEQKQANFVSNIQN